MTASPVPPDAEPVGALSPELHAIVGALYDAAAGLGTWRDACDRLARRFDLIAVQVLGVLKADGALLFSFEGGTADAEAWFQYVTRYHGVNPRITLGLSMPVGRWFHDHEHFDEAFVEREPFFAEFLIPYGARHHSGTKLIEDDEKVVFFGMNRAVGRPPVSPDDVAAVESLREHLVRAVRMHLAMGAQGEAARVGMRMLALMPQPVLVLDESRQLRFANARGRAALDLGDPLCVRAGFVVARGSDDERRWIEALRTLGLSGTVTLEAPRPRAVVRLRGAADGAGTLAMLVAVRPEATMHQFGERPMAIAVLHPLGADAPVDPLVASLAFGLTPGEARVAAALAAGQTVESIAATRSVSVSTVRTQLRAVFDKLGVSRQPEMVRRLKGLPRLGD